MLTIRKNIAAAGTSTARVPLALRSAAGGSIAAGMIGVLALTGSEAAAQAQPPLADEVQPIIVTGDRPDQDPYSDPAAPYKVDRSASGRLTEELSDTARSVTAIPREVIEDLGAQSVRDLVRTQPGISLGTGEGGNAFGDRIFIRGFEARNDVYIDYQRDPGVVSREIFAVEQVEVLKGPASTIAGRGTTGGALSLISKAPSPNDFVRAEAVLGTDATRRFTADVNRTLGDELSIRVNGLWHDAEVAGRDHVWNRRWGIAAAGLWEPTERMRLKADYYHLTADGLPDWGHPFDARSQRPFAVDRGNFYGLLDRDFLENEADIVTGRGDFDLSDAVSIATQTRWGRTRNSYIASAPEGPNITNADPDLWTVRANPKNRNAVADYLANFTEARGDFDLFGVGNRLVAGVEFSREDIVNQPFAFAQSEEVGAPIVPPVIILQPIFDPDPRQEWPLARTLSGASTSTRVKTTAVYVLDTIAITPELDIAGGLRYDDYDIEVTSINTAGTVTELRNSSGFLNWNASVTWKPREPLTFYFAAATSSNPSGEQIDGNGVSYGGLAGATASLDPEENRSFELGAKWTPGDGHLLLTAALFRINKTNARVNDPVTGGVQILAGEQRSQGFELGASGNLTSRWQLFGGYTFLDAEVMETVVDGVVVQRGGAFPNVPKHSFSLLSTYEIVDGLALGGQVFYSSARYGGSSIAGTPELPGYWRFDATARWRVSKHFEARLNALNLTDKTYYDAIYRSGTPFAYVAPGRSVLFTLSFSY